MEGIQMALTWTVMWHDPDAFESFKHTEVSSPNCPSTEEARVLVAEKHDMDEDDVRVDAVHDRPVTEH